MTDTVILYIWLSLYNCLEKTIWKTRGISFCQLYRAPSVDSRDFTR